MDQGWSRQTGRFGTEAEEIVIFSVLGLLGVEWNPRRQSALDHWRCCTSEPQRTSQEAARLESGKRL